MTRLWLAIVLAACSSPAEPVKRNLAIEFITTVNKDVVCKDWGTGTVDTALCQVGPITFWCRAGADFEPVCKSVADTRPKAEAKP